MPNLKDIKNRIQSIRNTKKITRAMKMVAAAKVKKAETSVKSSRPFSGELTVMFQKMLYASSGELHYESQKYARALDNFPALLGKRSIKTEGLIVITSNKGLAGAYNANIIRAALKRIENNSSNGIGTLLYIAGQKGISALQRKTDTEISKKYVAAADNPTASNAGIIAEDMAEDFVSEKIDRTVIITTRFNNMMSYTVKEQQVLPVVFDKPAQGMDALMEFVPDRAAILQKIVPLYITNTIFQSLLEASASELASRMTAMSAASKNAEEMINNLTVSYNKARQGAITQELIEIVSGASAQK